MGTLLDIFRIAENTVLELSLCSSKDLETGIKRLKEQYGI